MPNFDVMTTKSFAAFRQLSVHCDLTDKKPQLKKQFSVDGGFERWSTTQKSAAHPRTGKPEVVIHDDTSRRNLQIFLAGHVHEKILREPVENATDGSDEKPATTARPGSATAKRQSFQKRLNSAFNATVKEAPKQQRVLVRSTSAPCRAVDQRKSKFLSSRHKLSSQVKAKEPESGCKGKKDSRRVSPIGFHDVETMVSLVSPAGSDCEESGTCKAETGDDFGQRVPLPKEEKFVTFQQSSIHSVRSFSASFPSRRTTENHRLLTQKMRSSSQEKKVTLEKMRLNPATIERKLSPDETKPSDDATQGVETVRASCNPIEQTVMNAEENIDDQDDTVENKIENFESSKEKQCWNLYSKITKNGINVSFDTILRGMLTPTEYRTRQRNSNIPPTSIDAPI